MKQRQHKPEKLHSMMGEGWITECGVLLFINNQIL